MLKLHLKLLLMLRRKLKLRLDNILLLMVEMRMYRVRLIHGFLMNVLRLLSSAGQYDSSLDAGISDAGDAAGRRR